MELCVEASTVPVPAARAPWPLLARYSWRGPGEAQGAVLRAGVVWDVALSTEEESICETKLGGASSGEMQLSLPLASRPTHGVTNVNALVFTLFSRTEDRRERSGPVLGAVGATEPAAAFRAAGPTVLARFFFSCTFTEQGGLTIQFYPT